MQSAERQALNDLIFLDNDANADADERTKLTKHPMEPSKVVSLPLQLETIHTLPM